MSKTPVATRPGAAGALVQDEQFSPTAPPAPTAEQKAKAWLARMPDDELLRILRALVNADASR